MTVKERSRLARRYEKGRPYPCVQPGSCGAVLAARSLTGRNVCIFWKHWEEQYLRKGIQEKIKGELMISIGSPAILSVMCGARTVTVCSGQTAPAAQTHPVQEADLRRQMEKTGNTPFVFEQLNITMEGALVLSAAR